MSPVKQTAHGFPVSTWTHREVLALMDRAEEKAGPEDVGEQALMRGLDTAFPFFRLGLSWSSVGRRSDDRPHNGFQEFPCRGSAFTPAQLMSATIPPDSGCNRGGCGPVERPSRLERSTARHRRYACRCAMSSQLIAQMNVNRRGVPTPIGELSY